VVTGGTLRCWGRNAQGQLGDDGDCGQECDEAVDVEGMGSGVTVVGGGGQVTCAVPADGKLRCWGGNQFGQVGDNSFVRRERPVEVCGEYNLITQQCDAPMTGVVQIAGGDTHTCALLNTGAVHCWGDNTSGQLGDDIFCSPGCPLPSLVKGLTANVSAIASGANHSCALLNTGVVKCWGSNEFGQLGNGTHDDHETPVDVCEHHGEDCPPVLTGVVAIAAGGNRTCALVTGGRLRCWGNNRDASLTSARLCPSDCTGPAQLCILYQNAPEPPGCAVDLTNVSALTVGVLHGCFLRDAVAMCWGHHEIGQLGGGQTRCTQLLCTPPIEVCGDESCTSSLTGVGALSAGWGHTCALVAGEVDCWGLDNSGQLGDDEDPVLLCECKKAPVGVLNVKGGPTPTRTRTPTRTPTSSGAATATATSPAAATSTPTQTATLPPGVTPTATATPTATRTPTRTATLAPPTNTPTRTPTATVSPGVCGDVNGDGEVNSLDASLVLQLDAGRVDSLEGEESGDVNGDGEVNSIDAAIILQFDAALLAELDC
jgi:alpha-tubulin suppressor-like RCC1 family protein